MGTVERGDGEPQPVVVLNLSASGAMIQADDAPSPDEVYTLRFAIHRQDYALPFQVVGSLQQGDSYGWRGPFMTVEPDQQEAIARAVSALMGLSTGDIRAWDEVSADARRDPEAKVLAGQTPAGHDITILGKDVLEMGPAGLELFTRLMCELETV